MGGEVGVGELGVGELGVGVEGVGVGGVGVGGVGFGLPGLASFPDCSKVVVVVVEDSSLPYPHVQVAEHAGGPPETTYEGEGDEVTDPQPGLETATVIVHGGGWAPARFWSSTTGRMLSPGTATSASRRRLVDEVLR